VRDTFVERNIAFDKAVFDATPIVVGEEVFATAPLPTICASATASAAQACPKGRFHDASKAGECSDCLPGQYSATAGEVDCKGVPCAAGTYAAAAATEQVACIACKPGRYVEQAAQTSCKGALCAAGKLIEAGQSAAHACKDCAGGQYTDIEGEAACKGTKCVAGKYLSETKQSGECKPCQPGMYTDAPGQRSCQGEKCAAEKCADTPGAATEAAATCRLCPAGKTTSAKAQLCSACEQKPADPCPAGFGSNTGTEPGCQPFCKEGEFGAKGWAPCQPCTAGQFSDAKQATRCKQCPGGQFQPGKGTTGCIPCAGGVCYHGRTGPGGPQSAVGDKEFVKVLAQSDALNLFGWDRITNYKGVEAGEPLYYELFAAKEESATLYESRDFTPQVIAGLRWERLEFGANSAFKSTDNLRLVQAESADFAGSILEKYFVKGDNTLFFFKVGAKLAPELSAATQDSSAREGVIESPEPPVFIVAKPGGNLVELEGKGVPDPKPGQLVRLKATFVGKPLPSEDEVTWMRNSEPVSGPSKSCKDEENITFACPRITHECERNRTIPRCTTTLTIPAIERAHPGKYKAELVTFATKGVAVQSPEVTLGLECLDCGACDPGAVEDQQRGECICNPGRYRGKANGSTLLGFKCTECHEGWDCTDKQPTQGVDVLATVPVKVGFWRYNAEDKISVRCRDHAPNTAKACVGGTISAQCAEHHTGVFCHTCKDGFATSPGGVCEPCPETSTDVGSAATGVGAVFYALLIFVLHRYMIGRLGLIKAANRGEQANEAKKAAAAALAKAKAKAAKEPNSFASQQVKIVVSWLQIVSAFVFTFTIPWPKGFDNLLKGLMPWVNFDVIGILVDFAAIKCNINTSFKNGFIAHMCLLPALVVACLAAALLSHFCVSASARHKVKERAIKIVGFVIFVMYPGLCSKIFSVWDCVPVDGKGTEFLAADLSIQCHVNTDGHTTLVGLAFTFMMVYALGIPTAALLILRRNQQAIYNRDRALGLEIGQLYQGYQRTVWFWEVVQMVRKLVLTGALILLSGTGSTQIAVGCVVCALYTAMFLWVQPLGLMVDHIMELLTSLQLMITLVMGLYLKAKQAQDAQGGSATRMQDKLADALLLLMFGMTAALGAVTLFLGLSQKKLKKLPKFQWLFKTLPELQRSRADVELKPLPEKEGDEPTTGGEPAKENLSVTKLDDLEKQLDSIEEKEGDEPTTGGEPAKENLPTQLQPRTTTHESNV
jgi:hypothetical protein